jgi:hypothetical protein
MIKGEYKEACCLET